jgi:hypothetical protein
VVDLDLHSIFKSQTCNSGSQRHCKGAGGVAKVVEVLEALSSNPSAVQKNKNQSHSKQQQTHLAIYCFLTLSLGYFT